MVTNQGTTSAARGTSSKNGGKTQSTQRSTSFPTSSFGLVSRAKTDAVCQKDSIILSLKPKEYVQRNCAAYYIAINLWLLVIIDVARDDRLYKFVEQMILDRGLRAVVLLFAKLADACIEVENGHAVEGLEWAYIFITHPNLQNLKDKLQVFRFLKRFSPMGADKMESDAVDKLVSINNSRNYIFANMREPRCQLYTRSPKKDEVADGYVVAEAPCLKNRWKPVLKPIVYDYKQVGTPKAITAMPYWLLERIKEKLDRALPDPEIPDDSEYTFRHSNGVCSDAKTLLEKLKKWVAVTGGFENCRFGNGMLAPQEQPVKPICVPKTFKVPRVIVPQPTYQCSCLHMVRLMLQTSSRIGSHSRFFNVEDQETNRLKCLEGSINKRYATVDMSSASDSISRYDAYRALPDWVVRFAWPHLEKKLLVNGSTFPIRMFGTSGNPITFIVEGHYFLAFAEVARDLYIEFTGDKDVLPSYYFGDDGVVDVKILETLISLFEIAGFIVNEDKTFTGTDGFRESCGVEYLHGMDVKSIYWPRAQIADPRSNVQSLASMISLQHEVIRNDWHNANLFMTWLCKACYPQIMEGHIGDPYESVWSLMPQIVTKTPRLGLDRAAHKETLSLVDPAYRDREVHSFIVPAKTGECFDPIFEAYLYDRFLRWGPVFDDKFCRDIGVSTPNNRTDRKSVV